MSDINAYTTAQIANLTPQSGDLVLNTDDNAVQLWNGSAWKIFNSDVSPFSQQYSLSLDGINDYVALGNSSDLAPSSITISAWIKVTGSVGTFNYIVSRAGSTYGSYHLRYTNTNKFNAFIGHSADDFTTATSSSAYTLTDWHHVAFTYDQTNLKLYVDGAEAASVAKTTAIDYTAAAGVGSNTYIGSTPMGYPSPLEGLIDEVALFNSALSAPQIASLRDTSGSNPVPANIANENNLVGWWRMEEGSGSTVVNTKAPGTNDGTINGATFVSGAGNIPG